ncbi:MAG: methionine biosynthesis protein MetW [Pelotomaculum sp.]|uniref:Methionine biosynthesis protein MetW n=1 Tax=Pelotomaculum thermopropionicum (strain DSM 13744 / JCM 10971 / SI) TaxID=370438 RepID=A5D5P2_PELTS|nr:methionine biosynthesis protein MetW [Pelotomaculum sp.]BAF58432.1 hypothetical protein PTH_0251 [Pelotomaculum thermopropionicum SI]
MNRNGGHRFDHEFIYEIVPGGASVLDLGCGDGELLARLIEDKKVQGLGIEKDIDQVAKAISRRVPVLHTDLDLGLAGFPDNFFDFVILEKTLQVVNKPLLVLEEMLRVGGVGVISFPNFSHWNVVASLILTGRMPVTPALPYHWYDTPNIHLFTVKDFLDWARTNNVAVEQGLAWVNGKVVPLNEEEDIFAEEVLFVISRNS